jgi:hypothetical protein
MTMESDAVWPRHICIYVYIDTESNRLLPLMAVLDVAVAVAVVAAGA